MQGNRTLMACLGRHRRDELVSGVVEDATSRVDVYHWDLEADQERIQHQEGEFCIPSEVASLVLMHLQAWAVRIQEQRWDSLVESQYEMEAYDSKGVKFQVHTASDDCF